MLILLPNLLDENAEHKLYFPTTVDKAVSTLDGIIAESEKAARHFLKRFVFPEPKTFRDIPIRLLNEHTSDNEIHELGNLIRGDARWGLISDCGLPCLADPGAKLVLRAHHQNIAVEAHSGPSSIVLALMLSGLSAQSFAFHGYLERDTEPLTRQIRELEKQKTTQVAIDAPYRSAKLLSTLVQTLNESTWLCVAADLTLPSQLVITKRVREWRKSPLPTIDKKPTVFLFLNDSFRN